MNAKGFLDPEDIKDFLLLNDFTLKTADCA
jgi:hypothetical protein